MAAAGRFMAADSAARPLAIMRRLDRSAGVGACAWVCAYVFATVYYNAAVWPALNKQCLDRFVAAIQVQMSEVLLQLVLHYC